MELSIVLRVFNTILVESDIGLNNEILSFPSFSEISCYLLFSHLSLKRICRNISQKGISSEMTLLFLPPKGNVMMMKEIMYCVFINRVERSQTVNLQMILMFYGLIFFGKFGNFPWDKNTISKEKTRVSMLKLTFQVGDLMMNRTLFSLFRFQLKVIQF